MGDEITFDNIDSSPPIEESSEPEAGVEQVPEIPKDKLENPEDSIADDNSEKSKKDSESKPKETTTPEKKEGEEPVSAVVSINGEDYELAKLLEDPEMLNAFSQKIKDNELRRSDYSKKTAELARSREQFETEKQKFTTDFHGYLNDLNGVFMETPRLFLLKTLGVDANGQQLTPELAEKAIGDWVSKLSGELKMGKEYNPSQLKRQYEQEARLRKLEEETRNKEETAKKQQYELEVNKLSDHIKTKVNPTFSENSSIHAIMEKLPWMKEKLTDMALDKFNKAYKSEYVENDPSWDDYRYVDNFNFNQIWSEVEKEFEEAYEIGREKYLEKKKEASKKKPTGSSTSATASQQKDKSWTFEDFF